MIQYARIKVISLIGNGKNIIFVHFNQIFNELKKVNPINDDETLPGYLNCLRMSDFAARNVVVPLLEAFVHV